MVPELMLHIVTDMLFIAQKDCGLNTIQDRLMASTPKEGDDLHYSCIICFYLGIPDPLFILIVGMLVNDIEEC